MNTRPTVTFRDVRCDVDTDRDAPATGALEVHADVLVPWDVSVQLNWWGDTVSFAPGSVRVAGPPGRVKFLLDHRTAKPFGYGATFTPHARGLAGSFTIPRAELADPEVAAAVRQMGNGVRDAVSVGVDFLEVDETLVDARADRWHVTVLDAALVESSTVTLPRFDDARHDPVSAAAVDVTAARWSALRDTVPRVHRLTADPDPDPEPDDEPDPDPDESAIDTPEAEDAMPTATIDDPTSTDVEAARRAAHRAGQHPGGAMHAGAGRYPTFGHYVAAAAAGLVPPDYRDLIAADLVDQITTSVPGLTPEAWIGTVVDLLGASTPTVQAFSRYPLPTSGMTVNIPVVKQSPDVGPQAAEKTDIATRLVTIDPAAFPVATYAGGQDVSLQTIQRTEPGYLNILMRLFLKQMAVAVNKDAAAALVAGTTAAAPVDPLDLNGSFIDAAATVLAATFTLPTVVILGTSAWKQLGKATGSDGRPLFPGLSPVNPLGSFTLGELQGNVRGLDYYVDPQVDPTVAVLGIPDAFASMLGPVGTLTADVPQQLGRDVAVYEFCAFGVVDARGLVKLTGFTGAGSTGAASLNFEPAPARKGKDNG